MSRQFTNSVKVPLSKSKGKLKNHPLNRRASSQISNTTESRSFLHPKDANAGIDKNGNSHEIRTIRINVGGTIFETLESTLHKIPESKLAQLNIHSIYYRSQLKEYFFDRDPEIFKVVLNYHRIGELHLPLHICGPLLEKELQYWGMPEQIIEKCCWIHYIQLKSQKYSLVDFENFFAEYEHEDSDNCCNLWSKCLWKTFNRPSSSKSAMMYAVIVSAFVILSIFAFIAESHPKFKVAINKTSIKEIISELSVVTTLDNHENSLWSGLEYIDYCCLAFFTMDLFLRFSCTPNRLKFLGNILTIIEIISVIPYYVDICGHFIESMYKIELSSFLKTVHVLRIFGVLRIFKILRYYSGLQVLIYTLRSSYKDLLLMLTFIGVATLFFSTLIYHVDDRTVFTSIPAGFWWSIITMTTVGYGDIYPKFFGGYIVGSACSLVGVLVVAFTVPILVNSFMLYYSHAQSILMIRQEDNLNSMSDDERIYLNHTFNTLKRMSFYTFLPEFDSISNQKESSSFTVENLKRSSPIGECKEDLFFLKPTSTMKNDLRPSTLQPKLINKQIIINNTTNENYLKSRNNFSS